MVWKEISLYPAPGDLSSMSIQGLKWCAPLGGILLQLELNLVGGGGLGMQLEAAMSSVGSHSCSSC